MNTNNMSQAWVLQICHGYEGPFLDCARQYAVLFADTPYKVLTVYLSGKYDAQVEAESASDEVVFLEYSSKALRGLKLGAIRAIRHLVSERNFALCIAHRFKPTYIACLATRLPVIGVNHAFGVYRRRFRQWFANAFSKRLMLLGVSNAVRDDLRASLPAWPDSRIETLYNRIDIDALKAQQVTRESAREHLGLPQDVWVVGNVGRLHPDKDQETLIRGFAKALPDLPAGSLLVIVGRGRLEARLRALAEELGIEHAVRLLGQIPNAKYYFKAFDVFVLTSDHEPFGMVLLEAMVAGIPLICSDCGGGREVVDSVGILFPQGQIDALSQKVAAVCASQEVELKSCRSSMVARLNDQFSDRAVESRFWALPFLTHLS
ncbi:glycosyl transferase [Pseudomonas sp. PA15(2017)]|uniref:glycosyltransferase n=1 Tax=Pseudomonas sp. PA15(2017) TaxID=1932111 RepID=UPI00095C073C|nr:glycosyltransferase [Pseudomonas sp. PA15(2017)]OLU24550.1 glycosyl transferase [Pseudomonas sp. PA15(2017)]